MLEKFLMCSSRTKDFLQPSPLPNFYVLWGWASLWSLRAQKLGKGGRNSSKIHIPTPAVQNVKNLHVILWKNAKTRRRRTQLPNVRTHRWLLRISWYRDKDHLSLTLSSGWKLGSTSSSEVADVRVRDAILFNHLQRICFHVTKALEGSLCHSSVLNAAGWPINSAPKFGALFKKHLPIVLHPTTIAVQHILRNVIGRSTYSGSCFWYWKVVGFQLQAATILSWFAFEHFHPEAAKFLNTGGLSFSIKVPYRALQVILHIELYMNGSKPQLKDAIRLSIIREAVTSWNKFWN